ncbi:ABC transporter ATP-binding protein [Chloroflexota bacterium]
MERQVERVQRAGSIDVQITNLSKTYHTRDGAVHALDKVSFNMKAGEFISVVGPSGCGKSTMLLIVAGLIPKSHGKVVVGGVSVDKPYTNLGIVFQDAVLLDWRKVISNIMLQVEIRGLDKEYYEQRALELLASMGLEGFEHKYPFELSGGMKQRVSICRALIHDPPLLLMDEPFGAIDALTRDQMNLDLQRLWMERKKTVIFVTHSIMESVFLSDRVIVMSPRPGKIDEVIDIELPRPRRLAVRESPKFGEYARRIRNIFEARGVLSDVKVNSRIGGMD